MGEKVHGTFVGEKINKIRWKPEMLMPSEIFISGSWDNEVNQIVLWKYPSDGDDLDVYPCQKSTYEHDGDVTEMKFINNEHFVASSSLGCVRLFQMQNPDSESPQLKMVTSWDQLHHFRFGDVSSCSALSCFEDDVATVGEDGRLVLLTARKSTPVRTIDNADSCSIRCVCFLKHNEVLTGNLRGQMKIWDLKNTADKPASTFMLSGDQQIGVMCVAHHPTQRHMMLAGAEDGSLTVWDMRHSTFPVTLLSAHSDTVTELQFHNHRPEHLFTCSVSGEIWHWDTSSMARITKTADFSVDENPWLSTDSAKHRLEVFSLMPQLHKPINSLDVNEDRVVCGCDNEAVYVFNNVALK